jgi:type II secretory pathway pseudopilin PulG
MTLIELLVTIVILVTVLAGVIPVLSPNNDARRIRSAAQQLQSMLAQAQALAAREGRPYGVGFRETQVEIDTTGPVPERLTDGVALEAFFISEPKPYAGFSEYSRARLMFMENGGAFPDGSQLQAQFVLAGSYLPAPAQFPDEIAPDPLPPNVIRRGDVLRVGGRDYRVIDPDQNGDGSPEDLEQFRQGDFYTFDTLGPGGKAKASLAIEPVKGFPILSPNYRVDMSPNDLLATTPKSYKLLRQAANPATRPGNTAGPPLQFPRGVGIDMLASGVDYRIPSNASDVPKFLQFSFTDLQSRNLAILADLDLTSPSDRPWPRFTPPLTVGVMFAPSGALHAVWVNGETLQEDFWVRPQRVYLLLGRSENSTRTIEEIAGTGGAGSGGLADFSDLAQPPAAGTADPDAEEVATRREQLNWLNRDSLWVTVVAKSGRAVTSPNDTAVDPRVFADSGQEPRLQVANQIQAARTYARELESVSGGQ